MSPATVHALVWIGLQSVALSLLFVLTGKPVVQMLLPCRGRWPCPCALICGGAFFVGLAEFVVLWLVASRIIGSARVALWLTLGVMLTIAVRDLILDRHFWIRQTILAGPWCVLVTIVSITNATLWMRPSPPGTSQTPTLLEHFGSIHSGRYANYAIFIAQNDRVPFLAQNIGQSLLASCHMLQGVNAPLAALMVWIPLSITALAYLLFGILREQGLSLMWSLTGTYMILYCNIVVSHAYAMVFDNGSPFGFVGYTDLIASVGTFLIAAAWLGKLLLSRAIDWYSIVFPPGLFGVYWCWTAPQNIVVGATTALIVCVMWMKSHPLERSLLLRRTCLAGTVFAVSLAIGALNGGAFLPSSMQEDIAVPVFLVNRGLRIMPYIQYSFTQWSYLTWHQPVPLPHVVDWDAYSDEKNPEQALQQYRKAVVMRWVRVIASELVASVRAYGFLLLGLVLMGRSLRREHTADPPPDRDHRTLAFWGAALCFAIGYIIVFLLELEQNKWCLTRFLVPGAAASLILLVLSVARLTQHATQLPARFTWPILLIVGTWGPWVEFYKAFHANWIDASDPLVSRLNLLITATGPFLDK